MKIAMLTNNYKPFVGGVPISVERQAQELVKLGHEVTVFAPEYGETAGNAKENGSVAETGERIIRFRTGHRCMENGMVYPKMFPKEILHTFECESFDLIHTHHPMFVGPVALYLGRKYHLPIVYTYHTRYEDYLHYLNFLKEDGRVPTIKKGILTLGKKVAVPNYMRWFTNQCDLVLAPTAGMQKRIRENGTRVPMAVFPTGLKDEFFQKCPQKATQIRQKYSPVQEYNEKRSEENSYLFCTTGRLEEEKNPRFLLKGIRKLKQSLDKPFRVLLIGDGSMRQELEQETIHLGIEQEVCFAGNVPNDEINSYMQACDLFLFSSKSETQGIVLAEALAAGLPVVAVDSSGVEDIVVNGVNGYRTADDVEDWVQKVGMALKNRQKMSGQAELTAAGYRASRLAEYEQLLYGQCVEETCRNCEEVMEYENETGGGENPSETILRLFKTS